MEATLKKWGNSLACRIPSSLAKECGLTDQSSVEVTACDGKIVISRISPMPVFSLEELVSRITPENKHDYADTDFGGPVGREML
jgi:antitoxin MazE